MLLESSVRCHFETKVLLCVCVCVCVRVCVFSAPENTEPFMLGSPGMLYSVALEKHTYTQTYSVNTCHYDRMSWRETQTLPLVNQWVFSSSDKIQKRPQQHFCQVKMRLEKSNYPQSVRNILCQEVKSLPQWLCVYKWYWILFFLLVPDESLSQLD